MRRLPCCARYVERRLEGRVAQELDFFPDLRYGRWGEDGTPGLARAATALCRASVVCAGAFLGATGGGRLRGVEPQGAGADGVRASGLASTQRVVARAGVPSLAGGVASLRISGAADQAQTASRGCRQPGAGQRAGGCWCAACWNGSGVCAGGVGRRRDAWRASAVSRVGGALSQSGLAPALWGPVALPGVCVVAAPSGGGVRAVFQPR